MYFVGGGRTNLDYKLGWDKHWKWGIFKPSISLRYLDYQLDTNTMQTGATIAEKISPITVPIISLDSNMSFEKQSRLFSGYKQTLEPRLFYLNSKYHDQSNLPDFDTKEITPSFSQLFWENRFVGGDRISDDHRLSLGLSTSIINQKNGNEKFRASIAQAIYFDERRVSLFDQMGKNSNLSRKKSDLAFEIFYRINNQWRFNNEAVYNNQEKKWAKASASLYYKNENKLLNMSYRYTTLDYDYFFNRKEQSPIEQLDMSFQIPTSYDISWVGRWRHDFTNNRELEMFSGFEYNNCCWRAGLVVRRWLPRNNSSLTAASQRQLRNGIFLQIQFKGITGDSGRVTSLLKKGIYGYESLGNY